ncbi:MAG: hypothetical protein Q8M24_20150 [Pseudolabrys sp.]|nr:hypothetical protein [Pseudolabrys sp.]MDP2297762.1 hypothetical protein [Pseudolabrys sp.]
MPAPQYPRYVSPKERAENRARIRSFIVWGLAGVSAFLGLMLYAYTDQAPAGLRSFAFQLDGAFGYPVLALIRAFAG